MTAVVYRIYDKTGRLIYIGCTADPETRLIAHRSQSWWGALTDQIDIEWHDSVQAARVAEAEAIRTERPAFNVTHTGSRRRHLTDADADVCRAWAGGNDWRIGRLPVSLRELAAS